MHTVITNAVFFSAAEGSSHDKVFPFPDEGWRLGLDAESIDNRPQCSKYVFASELYRQFELRFEVSEYLSYDLRFSTFLWSFSWVS